MRHHGHGPRPKKNKVTQEVAEMLELHHEGYDVKDVVNEPTIMPDLDESPEEEVDEEVVKPKVKRKGRRKSTLEDEIGEETE